MSNEKFHPGFMTRRYCTQRAYSKYLDDSPAVLLELLGMTLKKNIVDLQFTGICTWADA